MKAKVFALSREHEYITPEHLLIVMCESKVFQEVFEMCGGNVALLRQNLLTYVEETLEKHKGVEPIESFSLQQAFIRASEQVMNSGKSQLEFDHLLAGIMCLPESYGVYYIEEQGVTLRDLLYHLCHEEDFADDEDKREAYLEQEENEEDEGMESSGQEAILGSVEKYVTHLNEFVRQHDEPLIGREDILNRTIQVLCRKTKNNPVHVGEPGVGKTAITLGLARLINEGKVPSILENAQIFSLDLGATLAGTQYRGDFEKRFKKILDKIKNYDNPIVYIDEIHNIVGAGSLGAGSLDASNLLKPYLTGGHIKFIGATTYEEYKKYFEKDKSLIRRFQTIEVSEPTLLEAKDILKGLKSHYEAYHKVTYTEEAINAAVELSHQYINDRFLPDKAIDLLDEAGAYYTVFKGAQEQPSKKRVIDKSIIEQTLARICHIPEQNVKKDEIQVLKQLESKLKQKIFGQNQAIEEITRCIKLSRSGLSQPDKPIASMLFVGPTGVGKTEIAKCLASRLGVKLIRFDMSEYTEKHTASKLIGSPPGYVGYEEGGLLTDAIRQSPYCVLLLDEIEKAHHDIYNILLQVMDYATLTDNKGRKADFRNVILIMTSNAGASRIGKNLLGFGERRIQGEAIQDEVKKVFTPEFRNRLTGTIVFNPMTEDMAISIVKKELAYLKETLKEKAIEVSFDKNCITYIAKEGTSAEYGAREINRLIESKIKPLFVEEILFGKLKKGGKCKVTVDNTTFKLIL